jgi:hypothetical protein
MANPRLKALATGKRSGTIAVHAPQAKIWALINRPVKRAPNQYSFMGSHVLNQGPPTPGRVIHSKYGLSWGASSKKIYVIDQRQVGVGDGGKQTD